MGPDIARILIDRQTIAARVREMGRQLSTDLEADLRKEGLDPASHPDRVVMVPILTGGIVFVADLIREMLEWFLDDVLDELGSRREVEYALRILSGGTSADRDRIHRASGIELRRLAPRAGLDALRLARGGRRPHAAAAADRNLQSGPPHPAGARVPRAAPARAPWGRRPPGLSRRKPGTGRGS